MKPLFWGSGALALQFFCVKSTSFSYEAFGGREATIDGVHDALFSGLVSCRDVVSSFIARIGGMPYFDIIQEILLTVGSESFNPTVNAIISLNPNALTIADDLDAKIASGNATGALFCIPILLKDNYDTVDMNTTGGCLDLAGNRPTVDAPTVTAFRDAGAIILGKTNLHELALEGLSVSSLGGQTINPYDHSRTPGGSSGGTGAVRLVILPLILRCFGSGAMEIFMPIKNPDTESSAPRLLATKQPVAILISYRQLQRALLCSEQV